ncbi:hypothetical protein [Pseudomonas gingeri]|uniref:Uncharacterized protein n=1 Tax=Pseudomonas gingeri TaxID=117681 RepID=A0A7Y7Y262_9PSED|nr:hypothetical protein [Pseudomonas gingeri]NWC16530.1 hypothetical protein [Pseudomonas gingeri]
MKNFEADLQDVEGCGALTLIQGLTNLSPGGGDVYKANERLMTHDSNQTGDLLKVIAKMMEPV